MTGNPYQPPAVPTTGGNPSLDPKLEKRLDTLYRNGKQFPVLIVLGLFVPVFILFAIPLGLVYSRQRKQLLVELKGLTLSQERPRGGVSVAEKAEMLRRWEIRFIVAPVAAAALGTLIGIVALFKYFEGRNLPERGARPQHSHRIRP